MKNQDQMLNDRFNLKPFEKKVWLSSPTMHGEEFHYMKKAYDENWVSTVGENIDEIEKNVASFLGCGYAVALSSGTSALHLAVKLAGEKIYGSGERVNKGVLLNKKVFCSDLTFAATANPIAYEGGEGIFIDAEKDTWNMDPGALKKAFEAFPDVRLIVLAHLYGTPAKIDEIRKIAREHGAFIVEDAAESLGATYKGKETGTFGDYGIISFNGNKIITGSSGGMFLTDSEEDSQKVRKWSTQSRENAPWYQHKELGYNYRMSNVIAGVVRGQLTHLGEHIEMKRAIYERYMEGFKDIPVKMNPYEEEISSPNFWLSSILIDHDYMCKEEKIDTEAFFTPEHGKSCPTEVLDTLKKINAEGRPIWKPMHLEPIYRENLFFTAEGKYRRRAKADSLNVDEDIFKRGLCLPSDIKMTKKEQDYIIEVVKSSFA